MKLVLGIAIFLIIAFSGCTYPPQPVCGNGVCESPIETQLTCPVDCGNQNRLSILNVSVYDNEIFAPFNGAMVNIYLLGKPVASQKTDSAGNTSFKILSNANQKYDIEVSAIGYTSVKQFGIILNSSAPVNIDFELNGENTLVNCKETDGGQNFSQKGTTNGYDVYGGSPSRISIHTDECLDNATLQEFYCGKINEPIPGYGYLTAKNIQCKNGCRDGACQKGNVTICGDGLCTDFEDVRTCKQDCDPTLAPDLVFNYIYANGNNDNLSDLTVYFSITNAGADFQEEAIQLSVYDENEVMIGSYLSSQIPLNNGAEVSGILTLGQIIPISFPDRKYKIKAVIDPENYVPELNEENNIILLNDQNSFYNFRQNCKEMYPGHNSTSENRVNIVFNGVNYTSEGSFKEVAKKALDLNMDDQFKGIFAIKPFSEMDQNNFNFWVLISEDRNFSSDQFEDLNQDELDRLSREFTNLYNQCALKDKYTINLSNFDFEATVDIGQTPHSGLGKYGQAFSIFQEGNLSKEKFFKNALIHELGHLIGELGDEYIYGFQGGTSYFQNWPSYPQPAPNFYINPQGYEKNGKTTTEECVQNTQWKSQFGQGCGNNGEIDCIEYSTSMTNVPDGTIIHFYYKLPILSSVKILLLDETTYVDCNPISSNEYKCSYNSVIDEFPYIIINGEKLQANGKLVYRTQDRPYGTTDDLFCTNPNCVNEVFCFVGAEYGVDVYRPTAFSAMQSHWVKALDPIFNPVNEQIIRTKLSEN